jgi:hypothetical protein
MGLEDLSDEAVDAFTVYSQLVEPAATEAPPLVRRALSWLAGVAAEAGVNAALPPALPDAAQAVSYAGAVVRLRACMEQERAAACRVTVQRVTGSSRQPFLILLWR